VRLLHTSDWHLGRTLHGFSLAEAQASALDFVVETAIAREVDAVVICGDVFDRAVPPVESIRLLNRALATLDSAGITSVVIAGNHDSGDRLSTYSALLRSSVHILGMPSDAGVPIVFEDEHGPVLIYPLPFLEPDAARIDLSTDGTPLDRSHEAVVTAALDRVQADRISRGSPRSVVLGHVFVAAAGREPEESTSQSERDLSVGGVQVVPDAAFVGRDLAYVALGHLHRPQRIRTSDPVIHYSGSLLRYSLSEATHEKSLAIVDIGPDTGRALVEEVVIPQPRGMVRLVGTIEDLTGPQYAEHALDFVELVVTDAIYPERLHARLDAAFPFALVKVHRPTSTLVGAAERRGDSRGREPVDVVADFIRKVAGRDPSSAELAILQDAYEAASR
jgi:exonuclease SbcD